MTVDDYQIEHLRLRKHLHGAGSDLTAKRGITTEQKLLAGLPARVKCARDLCATERTIREQSAVLARERHALLNTLIDDEIANLGKTINVCLARPEIAAFDRVVEEPENAIAVVLVIFRRVNSTLCGNRVGATG